MLPETLPTLQPVEPRSDTDEAMTLNEQDGLIEEDLLVEEISIDGMCGVY